MAVAKREHPESNTGIMPLAERVDPAARRRLSGPAIRTFQRIADAWSLPVSMRRALLGHVGVSTHHKWAAGDVSTLSYDQLERLSLVLGIFKALRLLFADDNTGTRWLKAANAEPAFGGRAPLDVMTEGGIDGLYRVRRYLDAWRGVWN